MSNALMEITDSDLLEALEKDEFLLLDQFCGEPAEPAEVSQEILCQIDAMLGNLNPQELEVLQLLFGLDGQEPLSSAEVGARTDLSEDQVRRIKEQALIKLR